MIKTYKKRLGYTITPNYVQIEIPAYKPFFTHIENSILQKNVLNFSILSNRYSTVAGNSQHNIR